MSGFTGDYWPAGHWVDRARHAVAWLVAVAAISLSIDATASSALAGKVGHEFQLNTGATDDNATPSVAALNGGGFVAAWAAQDGDGYGIYGQRYNSAGQRAGSEFRINTTKTDDQIAASVAGLTNGGFVVAWTSAGQDGNGGGVYAQRYGSDGRRVAREFKVNTTTTGDQDAPSVATLSDGGFVVTWESGSNGVYAQRYDAAGKRAGKEIHVISQSNQILPSVAGLAGGGFVVTWWNANQNDVYAQRYSSVGKAIGQTFLVNTDTDALHGLPQVGALEGGGFVVVWDSFGQDGATGFNVYAQRYNATGKRVGGEIQVTAGGTSGNFDSLSVTGLSDGGFVVVWDSFEEGDGLGVYIQRYNDRGKRVGGKMRANTITQGDQQHPSVASLMDGGFVVTWDSHSRGVTGQRYAP